MDEESESGTTAAFFDTQRNDYVLRTGVVREEVTILGAGTLPKI